MGSCSTNLKWSYSSLKQFQNCPKQYYHQRIVKDVAQIESAAMLYGTQLHKAAEEYIGEGKPIPPQFAYVQPYLDRLNAIPGEKHCELRFGLKETGNGLEGCDFFAEDVWLRGVADLVVIDGVKAFSVDYKTGKSAKYADPKQLDVVAGALFVLFPEVETIKSGLLFVVSKDFVAKEHTRDKAQQYIDQFRFDLERIETAMETGVWNAKPSALCRFCPVVECNHHKD